MTDAEELDAWRTEWATLGGRADLARMLTERVAKDTRRIRRGMAGEVLAAIFSSSLSLWMAVKGQNAVAVVLCAGIFAFNGVWLTRLFTLREGSNLGEGLDGFIALTRRRLADDMRWVRFAFRASVVVTVAAVAWSAWAFVAGWERFYKPEPWRAVVGFGGVVVILAFVFAWLRSRHRKVVAETSRFEALVADSLVDE